MKKKYYKSCVAVLLTMVMIFGGVHIGVDALPPAFVTLSDVSIVSPSTTHIGIGDHLQLTCVTEPAGCAVTWSSSDTSIASVNENTGEVMGIKAGTVTITATAIDPIVSSFSLTDTINITVHNSVGISNNAEYYIMNCTDSSLLGREDSSYATSTNLAGVAFANKDRAVWTVSELSINGSSLFTFKNKNGTISGNLYLGINGTDAALATTATQFTLYRSPDGTYQGLYLIKYGDKYLSKSTNGDICFTTALDDDCYWSFMKVEKDKATHYCLYCVNGAGGTFNVTLNMDDFQAVLGMELGYECVVPEPNGESADAFDDLQDSDIFIYSGHGLPGGIYFFDEKNNCTGSIIVDIIFYEGEAPNFYLSDIPDNGLANARCVIYMACNTGDDRESSIGKKYNLVDSTFEKGAHFVLGTTESINMNDINRWVENFLGYIFEGNNIDYAAYWASEDLEMIVLKDKKEDGSLKYHWGLPEYSVGDRYQYLNIE